MFCNLPRHLARVLAPSDGLVKWHPFTSSLIKDVDLPEMCVAPSKDDAEEVSVRGLVRREDAPYLGNIGGYEGSVHDVGFRRPVCFDTNVQRIIEFDRVHVVDSLRKGDGCRKALGG